MGNVLHHYNDDHNEVSASLIVPFICDRLAPTSVVDVGCGVGQWLSVFKKAGVLEVLGLDGSHVPVEKRLVTNEEFIATDLTNPPPIDRVFDLVVSLEVAEHLPPENADTFCDLLSSLGNTIVFSAAIPGQTGENHLNEQPHEYWAEKFRVRGFVANDIFRPAFWNNDKVNWWYRQNMYLFQKSTEHPETKEGNQVFTAIHPAMLEMHLQQIAKLRKRTSSNGEVLKTLIRNLIKSRKTL